MIHLYATDARTMLEALDDGESFRRQQARECPCSDETDEGACPNCEEHLNHADDYADLAGVIAELLTNYEASGPVPERDQRMPEDVQLHPTMRGVL